MMTSRHIGLIYIKANSYLDSIFHAMAYNKCPISIYLDLGFYNRETICVFSPRQ